jgi:radical SAM superfamily enzyme YgiQ (UPF0313 family)
MKVLIANPPAYIRDSNRHFIQAGSRWSFSTQIPKNSECKDHYLPYPFFLGYSSALLKRDLDVKVNAIDACALDFDEKDFMSYVASYKPDILVMEVPTISFPLVMNIAKEIKDNLDCKIVIAGSHVTASVKETMKKYRFIDYCLLGEYEISLEELVKHSIDEHDNGDLKKVRGLAFRNQGEVHINQKRELLKDLDSLPFPDREDFPIEHYHDFEIAGKPCAQIITSRGCPASCIFCIERQVMYASPLYRRRDPAKVVDEIALVKERYKAKQVYFDDETMTVNRHHIASICNEIINRKLDIPWTCMGDITLAHETLKLMAKAGCVGVKFGVETVNTRTLADINKSFMNLDKVKQFVKWCKKLGLWTHATYMIGLPGDTRQDVSKTLDFAIRLDTDSAQFSIATPFPGTPFFEMAEENGWLATYDWTMYDGANHSVVSYPWLTKDEIEQFHMMALKRYYKHAIIQSLASPRKVFRLMQARGLTYAFHKVTGAFRGGE